MLIRQRTLASTTTTESETSTGKRMLSNRMAKDWWRAFPNGKQVHQSKNCFGNLLILITDQRAASFLCARAGRLLGSIQGEREKIPAATRWVVKAAREAWIGDEDWASSFVRDQWNTKLKHEKAFMPRCIVNYLLTCPPLLSLQLALPYYGLFFSLWSNGQIHVAFSRPPALDDCFIFRSHIHWNCKDVVECFSSHQRCFHLPDRFA